MDPAARHRALQLLGIVEARSIKRPHDGDGDGFYDPDGKGPAKDLTPLPFSAKLWPGETWKRLTKPAKQAAPADATSMAEHVGHWHSDLTGMHDLINNAEGGATATRLLHADEHSKSAVVEFDGGTEGVGTRYLGTPDRIAEDQADSDQLVSALARAIDIPGPRVLRIDEDRTVSDYIDGTPATSEDVTSDDGTRLGLLDLLAGIDNRAPDSVTSGPDGVVPTRSDLGFTAVDKLPRDAPGGTLPSGKPDKRTEQLMRVAAAIDAGGPNGSSRADIAIRTGLTATQRDELLAELLDMGEVALIKSSTGNTGHGARFVRIRTNTQLAGNTPAGASARWIAAATPPQNEPDLAFWAPFVDGGQWTGNPLTPADIAWLRQRLDEVRPQFEHLGRGHWWQFAADRLETLAQHAQGDMDLFA